MCERIIGEMEKLSERAAWKVVSKNSNTRGPYHSTHFGRDGWAVKMKPKSSITKHGMYNMTSSGYHVFRTRIRAREFSQRNSYMLSPYYDLKVIKVLIKGKALPFSEGWAVEQWKPVK